MNLGALYSEGKSVDIDLKRAVKYFDMACGNKNGLGCFNAGELHSQDYDELKHDYEKALDSYQKACELAVAPGCTALGLMYEEGKGDDADNELAASYYKIACNLKDAEGCLYIAYATEKGEGVKKDPVLAQKYYKTACNLGQISACSNSTRVANK